MHCSCENLYLLFQKNPSSQTCVKRSPLGQRKMALSDKWLLKRGSIHRKCSMTGQERWPFNTGDRVSRFDYTWIIVKIEYFFQYLFTFSPQTWNNNNSVRLNTICHFNLWSWYKPGSFSNLWSGYRLENVSFYHNILNGYT
jgi:hypothetical protein